MKSVDWTADIRKKPLPPEGGFTKDLPLAHRASVLLPLLEKEDGRHLLFEVRAEHLDMQPGDVCFPGGGLEPGESPEDAVIREASEELLITKDQIEILHPLPELIGPAHTLVTPFTGILHGYEGSFSKIETDRVFTVPLDWFSENEPLVYRPQKASVMPDDFPYELIRGGRDYPFTSAVQTTLFYKHPEAVIWGFTAKVVALFLSVTNHSR